MTVRDLEVHFALRGGSLARLIGRGTGTVKAIDGVDLDVSRGEVLGLVGESGSGKTTLGRTLLGLVRPTAGVVAYEGRDLARMSERALRRQRRHLQMVFQDPSAALNPSMTIEQSIGHPLLIHGLATKSQLRDRVSDVLDKVGLSPVDRFLTKFPSDLSGGQKQRAVIARAIITGPALLVADEPISMLDMSVRAKILQLMLDLKAELELTYVYITHDLASAKFFCDRIAIMYLGRVVEIGATEEIFNDPKHPYTKALLKAIPDPDPDRAMARDLPRGEIPDAADPPSGCVFHPRCPVAVERCGWEPRDLETLLESHWVSLGPDVYEKERALIANTGDLQAHADSVTLKPGGGRSVSDVEALLSSLRKDQADDPIWRGIAGIEAEPAGVRVDFAPGEDPALRPAGGVEVACVLYPASSPPGHRRDSGDSGDSGEPGDPGDSGGSNSSGG